METGVPQQTRPRLHVEEQGSGVPLLLIQGPATPTGPDASSCRRSPRTTGSKTRELPLDEVNEAMDALAGGEVVRQLLLPGI